MTKIKYIVHGGYTGVENKSNKEFFSEIVKDLKNEAIILLVFFASWNEDKTEKFNSLCLKLNSINPDKNFKCVYATKDDFLKQIEESDAVFFNGGRTQDLLETVAKFDLDSIRSNFNGKTIVGSSAGAYMLASLGASHDDENIRKGMGFLDIRLVCHYNSLNHPQNDKSFIRLKNLNIDKELVLLRDFEWKIFHK